MLGGFNTNVPYKDKTYHVQTEDGGAKYPILTTHLYHQGAILASEKYNYAEMLIENRWREKVVEKMKEQHKRVIRDLLAGRYTGDAENGEAHDEEAAASVDPNGDRTLDELVLDYIVGPDL